MTCDVNYNISPRTVFRNIILIVLFCEENVMSAAMPLELSESNLIV